MQTFTCKTRVDYSDTDQMGFVHHSNYLKYYEAARWNLFRQRGIPYKEIEDGGVLLPVVGVRMQYLKPAFYDEELTIETTVVSIKGAKLMLSYKMFNESTELINTATITVAFVNSQTRKPCKPPRYVVERLEQHVKKGEGVI